MFPHLVEDIQRVRNDPAFLVQDLLWISAACKLSIRLTIASEEALIQAGLPWLKQDIRFQEGPTDVHLLWSWNQAIGEDRWFGHYDVLVPSAEYDSSMLLPPDVSRSFKTWQVCFFSRCVSRHIICNGGPLMFGNDFL